MATVFRAVADEALELEFGFATRSPSLPDWRDANALHVITAAPPRAEVVLAAGRRLGITQIEVYDEQAAAGLLPGLESAGCQTQRFLLMAHDGERPAADPRVERCDPAELALLYTEWLRSEPELAARPGVVQQGIEAWRRLTARMPTRAFCLRDDDGRPSGMTLLLGDGPTVMVEDVYVDPGDRGHGHGGGLVATAAAAGYAAGAACVFLPTSTNGLAQRLYRRLGFEPVGIVHRFVLGEP